MVHRNMHVRFAFLGCKPSSASFHQVPFCGLFARGQDRERASTRSVTLASCRLSFPVVLIFSSSWEPFCNLHWQPSIPLVSLPMLNTRRPHLSFCQQQMVRQNNAFIELFSFSLQQTLHFLSRNSAHPLGLAYLHSHRLSVPREPFIGFFPRPGFIFPNFVPSACPGTTNPKGSFVRLMTPNDTFLSSMPTHWLCRRSVSDFCFDFCCRLAFVLYTLLGPSSSGTLRIFFSPPVMACQPSGTDGPLLCMSFSVLSSPITISA